MMDLRARFGQLLPLAVVGGALVGLLIAFALSLGTASRQFEHALIAQQQASSVADIVRDAGTRRADALAQSLTQYRDLIAAEGRYLTPAERPAQEMEMRRAEDLAAMAPILGQRARLTAMVRLIAVEEAREVSIARAELDRERRDTIALGVLLAAMAFAAAAFGARQLLGANRILTAELAARTAAIRAVDRSRRLFFAKASHELRTPVTAIRVAAEVALESGGPACQTLADIVAQAGFLDHRIADMLALAQADEGGGEGGGVPRLSLVRSDLAAAIDLALMQAGAYARAIDVGLVWDRPADPIPVLLDARWLGQAILTVIDNGLKFSDPGASLAIDCKCEDGRAIVTITDSGPGVLPRDLPLIFDAYYQADEGRLRGGTGLGLALARWVVEGHGGVVHAENLGRAEDGGLHGCRIVIALPLAAAA